MYFCHAWNNFSFGQEIFLIWLLRIYILVRKLLAIGDFKTACWKKIQTIRVESIHKAMRDFNSIYIELK